MFSALKRIVSAALIAVMLPVLPIGMAHAEENVSAYGIFRMTECSEIYNAVKNTDLGYVEFTDTKADNYIKFSDVDFEKGMTAISINGSSNFGGSYEIYADAAGGELIGSVPVAETGGVSSYKTVTVSISTPIAGVHDLYIKSVSDGSMSDKKRRLTEVSFDPADEADAFLSGIDVSGDPILNFSPYTFDYYVNLKKSVEAPPEISVSTRSDSAVYEIDPAVTVDSETKITVTAPDGETQREYRIHFTKQSTDFITKYDFGPSELPAAEGYTRVTPDDMYLHAAGYGFTDIVPLAGKEGNLVGRDRGNANSDKKLSSCIVGMDTESFSFKVDLPNGIYQISVYGGDALYGSSCGLNVNGAVVKKSADYSKNSFMKITAYEIEVSDGSMTFQFTRKSNNISINYLTIETKSRALLYDLQADGETVDGFEPGVYNYTVNIPSEDAPLPQISAIPMYDDTEVSVEQATAENKKAVISVKGSDGKTAEYTVTYEVLVPVAADIRLTGQTKELPLRYLGNNINYGSFYTGGNTGTRYFTDLFTNIGRYFVSFEYQNDSENGDGIKNSADFEAAKAAVKANPLDNEYIDWKAFGSELLSGNPGTPFDSMDRIITEMQKAGIEPMINFRSDSESLVKIPGTNNYADLWEWWEHNFVKAYFMAKSYGIKEFNLLNEPNFLGKSDMSSIMACYREGADAIRAGAAAALGDDVKVRIWGPGFYGDPTPSKWGDKFVKEMDSQMDVYDYHTYSDKDSENLKRIDAITARLEKYDSDGDIEPISISEWNYQLSAPAMDIYERMDNVMKTSGRFKMFVDNGIYAPFYFNMFRRYNRWGNALVYCTDAAAQSYNCTKMYYAMRILGRAFSNPDGSKLIAETELSGNTDNLEVFAAKTDKEYYVLLMNKDKKTSRTYNIDVSALGTTADKAFLREVSKFRNDDVVEQCSITDGRLTAEALTPQAIHLFVIPIEQEQQAEPTEIYSTRNNENNIEIIWKNQENVLEYKVERRETGDGAFETIAENVPFSFYTDTEAEPGKKYEYRVRSVYINGEAVSETAGPLALTNGGGKIVSPYVSTADEKYNPELFKAVSGNWLRNYCANGEDVLFYTESRAGSENIAVVTPELDNEFNDYTATIGFDLTYAGNGSYFGPVIRYIDEDNYYKLVYDFGSATGKIIKRKDGVETVLASEKAGAPHDEKNVLQSGKQQIMRCTVDGNRIDFSIKCNLCVPQVITAYDPDPIPYGTVGICAANGTKLGWDDIRLEAAFTDTFDGGGKRGEWKENGGKWVAEGGKYKRLDSEGSAFAVAGYDNSTDYYFQTDFDAGNMTGDASVDFYALYKDENNYFKYSVTADDQLVIIKRINGHDTELVRASTDDIPWTEKYRFGLQIEKQEHRVYINNVLAASFTELEPKLTYGSVGIGTTNTTASFDNVSMNAYLWDYNGGDTPYITAEDENGNRVDSLPETGSTTVSAHIPDGYTEEAPSFMAAVYDAQGILKQIIRPEPETKNTESGMTISLVIPEDITGGKVKIMLWDSISSMKPLCNSLLLLKSTSG